MLGQEVLSPKQFYEAAIAGQRTSFQGTRITGSIVLKNQMMLGLDLTDAIIKGSVTITGCGVYEGVILHDTSIEGELSLEGNEFNSGILVTEKKVRDGVKSDDPDSITYT